MFGYIIFNKPELKFREFDEYRSCYCGVCRSLKHNSGLKGQLSLNYDVTFLAILLTGLYEPESIKKKTGCILHPFKKRDIIENEFMQYSADIGLFLAYYKCIDDWKDDRNFIRYIYSLLIKNKVSAIKKKYKKKCENIERFLHELSEHEKNNTKNIDEVSGCFGNIMAEIFEYKDDIWKDALGRFGFYLGKYIYLMDAYDDISDDIKAGSYNILSGIYEGILSEYSNKKEALLHFSDNCRKLMTMMITECAREFEKLPVLLYADIIRNILYSGVWRRFNRITEKMLKSCEKGEK